MNNLQQNNSLNRDIVDRDGDEDINTGKPVVVSPSERKIPILPAPPISSAKLAALPIPLSILLTTASVGWAWSNPTRSNTLDGVAGITAAAALFIIWIGNAGGGVSGLYWFYNEDHKNQ